MATVFPTKILLATDGSEEAVLAAQAAAEIAQKSGSDLHVVHMGDEYHPGLEIAVSPTLLEETLLSLERKAQEILDEQVKKIEEAGGTIAEAHLRMGRPDREIVILAEEIGVGLIVLGSRGLGGIRRALMGSVSSSVVCHAHCPVLVVRAEKDGALIFSPKRILLATDGSQEAQLAAQTAGDLAQKMGSELHVVHARLMLPLTGYSSDETMTDNQVIDNEAEARKRVMQWLNDQVEKIEAEGGKVTQAHLRLGRPKEGLITLAEEIVSLAEEIGVGLIVIGRRCGVDSYRKQRTQRNQESSYGQCF